MRSRADKAASERRHWLAKRGSGPCASGQSAVKPGFGALRNAVGPKIYQNKAAAVGIGQVGLRPPSRGPLRDSRQMVGRRRLSLTGQAGACRADQE
jgi:hypothetical protein